MKEKKSGESRRRNLRGRKTVIRRDGEEWTGRRTKKGKNREKREVENRS
jgi:hypothetical protein